MSKQRVVAFDTSIISENAGDCIIMKYVNTILQEIWSDDFIINIPTHDNLGKRAKQYCYQANTKIMCGTNILTADMVNTKMWSVDFSDIPYIKNTILLGAGWREYEKKTGIYTKYFWNKVLSSSYIHSVRDNYTLERLKKIGIKNVVNTGCPTMWRLTTDFCKDITTSKGSEVVTTLTNYRTDRPDIDTKMINCLFNHYENVYIWIQALEDYPYLTSLNLEKKPIVIGPGLHNYDKLLKRDNIDYVGTRLHAGIEALNNKKRTMIIAKDNRALEIAKDTNLPVISESKIDELDDIIESDYQIQINIPLDNIEMWRKQFLK
jgi:hypothetical protein